MSIKHPKKRGLTCENGNIKYTLTPATAATVRGHGRSIKETDVSKPNCALTECERPARCKGWCAMHYARWKATGDPAKILRVRNLCSVDGCNRPCKGNNFCGLHYQRHRTYGDPLTTKMLPADERFWSKVDKRGPNDCWPWKGTKDRDGYAVFWHHDGNERAARYSYVTLVGRIPAGYTIDHVRARGCVRRDCTNPAHLEPVPPGVNTLRGDARSGVNLRKTHCDHGHEFNPGNTYTPPKRPHVRQCRTCQRRRESEYKARQSERG